LLTKCFIYIIEKYFKQLAYSLHQYTESGKKNSEEKKNNPKLVSVTFKESREKVGNLQHAHLRKK